MKLLNITLITLLSFSSSQLSASADQHAVAKATDRATCNRLATPTRAYWNECFNGILPLVRADQNNLDERDLAKREGMISSGLSRLLKAYTAHKNSVQADAEKRGVVLCRLVLPIIEGNLQALSEVVENPSSYDLAKAFLGGAKIDESHRPINQRRNYDPFPKFVFPRKK